MESFIQSSTPHLPGDTIAHIGSGGFAIVEEVKRGNKSYARKTLTLNYQLINNPSKKTEMEHRFQREIGLLRSLEHPNIPKIYDDFRYAYDTELESTPAYLMELAQGSFKDECTSHQWDLRENRSKILSYLMQAAYTLAFIHARNVIHRDIKPGNLLITNDKRLLISDFGLSKNTDAQEGQVTRFEHRAGTDGYQAPEQSSSLENANKQSDVYSFGAMLMEYSTGHLPDPWRESATSHALDPLPAPLQNFIQKCIALNPLDRYPDGGEMASSYLQTLFDMAKLDSKYKNIVFLPESLLEALLHLLDAGKDSLIGLLSTAYKMAPQMSAHTFTQMISSNVIKNSLLSQRASHFVKLIQEFNQKEFENTQVFSDVESVGEMYRNILQSLRHTPPPNLAQGNAAHLEATLLSSLLKKSTELHRFDGGREFLRCFCGPTALPEWLFMDAIEKDPDGLKFLQTHVHHEYLELPPAIQSALASS